MQRGWHRVVVAATGPSFTAEQASIIEAARERWRVIAINDAWRRLPRADVLFAADGSWWRAKSTGIRNIDAVRSSRFAGELWSQWVLARNGEKEPPPNARRPNRPKWAIELDVNCVRCRFQPGLTKHPDSINAGKNGGYMGVNLAYLFGARQIITVGIDMKKGPTGKQHFFGNHPHGLSNVIPFDDCIKLFRQLATDLAEQGVDVANCSTDSALDCFRRAPLEEALLC